MDYFLYIFTKMTLVSEVLPTWLIISYKYCNPKLSILHSNHDFLRLDIYLDLYILVVVLLYILTHNLPYIVSYGKAHRSEYCPNRTIEQSNNRIYT